MRHASRYRLVRLFEARTEAWGTQRTGSQRACDAHAEPYQFVPA